MHKYQAEPTCSSRLVSLKIGCPMPAPVIGVIKAAAVDVTGEEELMLFCDAPPERELASKRADGAGCIGSISAPLSLLTGAEFCAPDIGDRADVQPSRALLSSRAAILTVYQHTKKTARTEQAVHLDWLIRRKSPR